MQELWKFKLKNKGFLNPVYKYSEQESMYLETHSK